MRWGKIAGIVSSMLSSALWRVYLNVRKVSAAGFSSCRSRSPINRSTAAISILSSTRVVSVGRMNSYKWYSELPGSDRLSSAYQSIESFFRPARHAVGSPSTWLKLVSRTSLRRAVCRMEEISSERYVGIKSSPISRTCKFGNVSRNWNITRVSLFPIST